MGLDEKSIELWEQFSPILRSNKAKGYYLNDIREFSFAINKPFYMATQNDVAQYYEKMRYEIAEKEIAASTVLRKFRVLSRFANEATKMDIYPKDAAMRRNYFIQYVAMLRRYDTARRARKMNINQIDRLLGSAAEDPVLYTIIALICRLGMSVPEVCGLSGKDIYKGNGESWYIGIIRNKKRYLVYVPEDVRRILEKYEKISNSGRVDSSEPYFKNPYGKKCNKRMSERSLEMKIKALADANGLSGCSLRDMRNSAAVLMFAYGVTENDVANQLGLKPGSVFRYKTALTDREISEQASSFVNLQICTPAGWAQRKEEG